MSAGTINLTNNSSAVTGSGTLFSTNLKANDFIVVIVGGVTYTLGIKSVESATALTLITAYGGPTATGNAWTAVPNATLVGITAQVAADVAKAIRGLNLDKANWQQVFSGTGTITVTLPDGSTYTGPSWSSITASLTGKADLVSGAVAIGQGGTGGKTKAAAWAALATYGTGSGTAAQGNDGRLNSIDGKTGGTITGAATISAGACRVVNNPAQIAFFSAASNMWQESSNNFRNVMLQGEVVAGTQYGIVDFLVNNNAGTASIRLIPFASGSAFYTFNFDHTGAATARVFNPTSDERIKDLHGPIEDPLAKMKLIRGQSWNYKVSGVFGVGFTAQDVEKVFPDAVGSSPVPYTVEDGSEVTDVKTPDTYGVAAALHHEAILALMDKVEALEATLAGMQAS